MSDQLLIILRVCLLALVYLVFLRVLRAVWVELRVDLPRPTRAPQPRPTAAPVPAGSGATPGGVAPTPHRVQVVAPAAMAGTGYPLDGETTIGRAGGCGIPIDDSHISKLHARVFPTRGRWYVEDLGSTNGTRVNGSLIVAAAPVGPGDRIQVGDVVLELV